MNIEEGSLPAHPRLIRGRLAFTIVGRARGVVVAEDGVRRDGDKMFVGNWDIGPGCLALRLLEEVDIL